MSTLDPPAPSGPAAADTLDAARRSLRHELRTPLNHILGYCELLLEEASDRGAEAAAYAADLRRIEQAGRGLLGVVGDLLDRSARPAGGPAPDAVALEVRTYLTAIVGYSDLLREQAEEGGDVWLLADLARIHTAGTDLLRLMDAALASLASARLEPARADSTADDDAPRPTIAPATATAHLLVVDDNPLNRDVLARRLERHGFRVTTAADGVEALERLAAEPFDLVLLDIVMPRLDGFGVLRRLRADDSLRELPVLVLSAEDEMDHAVRCVRLGADDYLSKPVNPVLLSARIQACLERKRLRDREMEFLRQASQVTGPAAIAYLLARFHRGGGATGEPAEPEDPQERRLLDDLRRLATWGEVAKGDVLMRQGEPSDAAYVLLEGRLYVVVDDGAGGWLPVLPVEPGETVGEWGLVTGLPRTATVVATRDSLVVRIDRATFASLTERHARVLTRADRDVLTRLRFAMRPRPPEHGVTAIAIRGTAPGLPVAVLGERLAEALTPYGRTLVLDRPRAVGLLGSVAEVGLASDHPEDARPLASALADVERAYRFVLYLADPDDTTWTARCLRQADRVLVVGDAAGPVPVERLRVATVADPRAVLPTRRDLVLLAEGVAGTASTGTQAWLEAAPGCGHHHLRLDMAGDVRRLARRLAGQAVGLVLGGGGMRAAAHIGVLRALVEGGVEVDLVGGTSAGSLVGAQLALGWDLETIAASNRALMVDERALNDYTLPLVSVIAARRFVAALRRQFGETRIEDLRLPYFAVSANLTRAEVNVHQAGPLWRAVRASCSIPGVMPPVREGDDLLVDGGLLNNLPVDVMSRLCEGGPVIAVDLRVKVDLSSAFTHGDSLSGFELLASRLNPLASQRVRAPGITGVLLRASLLGSVNTGAAVAQRASLYINPPVGRFPLLDGRAADAMMELGYESARERVAAWLAGRAAPVAATP